ncbi:ABC transporter ATP-binding protein [Salinadaptatus halalkaliphilus]|uniref:Probable branched-chain amino acid transport ATP-binding protein LivG n=1 Tax=Salinadaptatus halalkaliphilus TaxID=2419781 RepID=A0A4V3VKT7_9EURY|nr:ABC transporter ATP-binding protein [Salinadaptatus halalkaliphilus]THE63027.1 ABC transporter ATP-binding protein [Salinadaptatus halalkaliphilus]
MLLETTDLTKRFDGLVAVDQVDLSVEKGEIQSIIGPNGAGKTTTFNLLTGMLSPSDGEIRFNGEDITDESSEKRVKRGISRSFQITNIFPELTVRKNIRIAVQEEYGYGWNFWTKTEDIPELEERTLEIIDYVGITADPDAEASTLSHGEKRLLELAIVVARDPELIMLDEPAAGMSEEETKEVVDLIHSLNEEYTILLIEHDIDLIMELSDTITVLANGAVIAQGTPEEVGSSDRVQEAYLGGEFV